MNRILSLFVVTLLVSAWPGPVAEAAETKRLILPQDLWAMKRLGSPALSPDGKAAVFTVTEWSIAWIRPVVHHHRADCARQPVVRLPAHGNALLTPQNSIYWNWEFQNWLARWTGGTPTLTKPNFDPEAK